MEWDPVPPKNHTSLKSSRFVDSQIYVLHRGTNKVQTNRFCSTQPHYEGSPETFLTVTCSVQLGRSYAEKQQHDMSQFVFI